MPDTDSDLLAALLALQPLESLARTGWVLSGVAQTETIAGHVLGTCQIVLALGSRLRPEIDLGRCLVMAVVHDAPEALLGDLPRSAASLFPAGAKAEAEAKAARKLLSPVSPVALERFAEYRAGETREARFVRLCDRLQLGVRLAGHHRVGVRGLEEFLAAIEALDCSEFPPAEALRREILSAVRAS